MDVANKVKDQQRRPFIGLGGEGYGALVLVIAALVTALGGVVLYGWLVRNSTLIQIYPHFPPMHYTTAIGFMLSGMALLALHRRMVKLATLLGLCMLTLGILSLLQINLQSESVVGDWFGQSPSDGLTANRARMGVNTAVCFSMLGLAFLSAVRLVREQLRFLLTSVIFMGVVALASLAFFGYVSGVQTVYGLGNLTEMAVHSAVGFMLVGVTGIISMRRGIISRKLLQIWYLIVIVVSMITVTLLLWESIEAANRDRVKLHIQSVTQQLDYTLQTDLRRDVGQINQYLDFLERVAQGGDSVPIAGISEFISATTSAYWVGLLTPAGELLDGAIQQGSKLSMRDRVYLREVVYSEYARAAGGLQELTLSEPMQISENWQVYGFYAFFPIHRETKAAGIVTIAYRYQDIIDAYAPAAIKNQYYIALLNGDQLLYKHNELYPTVRSYEIIDTPIDIGSHRLTLRVAHVKAFAEQFRSVLPQIVLFGGIILSVLIGLVYWLISLATNQAQLLAHSGAIRLRSIFDTVLDGIITIDARGIIQEYNSSAQALFGYSADEVVGRNINMLMPEPHKSQHDGFLENFRSTGRARIIGKNRAVQARRKDGSVFPLELAVSDMSIDGKLLFTGVLRDISEQVSSKEIIQQHAQELERSNEALKQFAYVASHDLQEPLRIIAGYSDIIQRRYHDKLDEKADKYLDYIVNGASRLQKMIQDLLEFSRIEPEKLKLVPLDLRVVIQWAEQHLHKLIEENNAKIEVLEFQGQVLGDEVLLSHVFQNLIANALKYRSEQDPQLLISATYEADRCIVCVQDNGLGIDEKFHQRIFEIFQRLQSSRNAEGSGIGLAIAKKIVESHGGKMWVESTPGEGSKFYLSLLLANC